MLTKPFRSLAAGLLALAALTSSWSSAAAAADSVFHWVDDPQAGTADLMFGEEPVLRYMYAFEPTDSGPSADTTKVYHHVFGPGTRRLITKGPGGKYPHHRGLYVGWNKTQFEGQQLDFWHCNHKEHIRHVRFLEMTGDAHQGSMTAEIHWNDPDGKPVIIEERTVKATRVPTESAPGFAWQIDWTTKLASQRGEIVLDGDRQHAGFQFRADQPVAESDGARYIRPTGFPEQAEAFEVDDKGDPPRHINLMWLGMTFELDGQKYFVGYFEDFWGPKPSLYSERPYGRFGAFYKTTLTPEKPLTMRYRILVRTGDAPDRQSIDKSYNEFLTHLQAGDV
jgi:hypothetical protein